MIALLPWLGSEASARDGNPVVAPEKVSRPGTRGVVPIFGSARRNRAEPSAREVQTGDLPSLDLPDNATLVVAPASWIGFFDFVLAANGRRASGEPVNSAMLPPDVSTAGLPAPQPCAEGDNAVLLDIDPQRKDFAPRPGLQPLAGLAEGLADLRKSGIVVLWISRNGADQIASIAEALQKSGLDPEGRDPILLAFKSGDRKQVIREEASETVCVLAIAGDRMGDFDELFDYLRNPEDARFYSELVGAGWFLVPSPFVEPQEVVSGVFTPGEQTIGQILP